MPQRMIPTSDDGLTHLSPAATRIGHALARPKVLAAAALAILIALGWLYLGLMVAGMAQDGRAGALGLGMGVFDHLRPSGLGALAVLCRPAFGHHASTGFAEAALVFVMWTAMVLAMMLPTAGPMIMTYTEIADTAARKGERVASPLALVAGYAAIWLGFAAIATVLQAALTGAALLDPAMASASPLFSGAVFIGAGAYQFSALKHACVTRCQRPFPFFLAHWSSEAGGVIRLGLRQGVYCLGCCWAMMLVMFAVGVMNVVWMAALGVIMAAEKIATTTRFSRLLGVVFVMIGAVLIATAVAAQWPA